MNIAFIPKNNQLLDNELFRYTYEPTTAYGMDRPGFVALKQKLESDGHHVATVDQISNTSVDRVVFIDNCSYYEQFAKMENRPGFIYMMREPPSVLGRNTFKNIIRLKSLFDEILTWNDMISETGQGYTLYRLPQKEYQPTRDNRETDGTTSCASHRDNAGERLLVNVSSRKYSRHPNELYSEREAIINYYDQNHPNEFSLYGYRWDAAPSLSDIYFGRTKVKTEYSVFQGPTNDKQRVYDAHLFALSFENMCGIQGYVSEKIFDCLRNGIVPVYYGASNVSDILPESIFIDYREYRNPQQLHEYLTSMPDDEYRAYIDSGQEFLRNNIGDFAPEAFAETLLETILDAAHREEFASEVPDSFELKAKADRMVHYDDHVPLSSIATVYDIVSTDSKFVSSKDALKLLKNIK